MFRFGLRLINEFSTSQKFKLLVWRQIAEKLVIEADYL